MIGSISPKRFLVILVFVLIASYALFQARFLILGPRISIESPAHGQSVSSSAIEASGKAHNVAWLTLNDRQIFTNENGQWREKLIVGQGTSIITLRGKDRFGRERFTRVEVFNNSL